MILAMILLRMAVRGSLRSLFLVWNLFLAVVPLYCSYAALRARRAWLRIACFALRIRFLPNAAYLFTESVHLPKQEALFFWNDLVLLFLWAAYGAVMGFTSLHSIALRLRRDCIARLQRCMRR